MCKKMTFEEANIKLEETLKVIENGELNLRESVEQYGKACELLSFCMKELEDCNGQIQDINVMLENLKGIGDEEDE